MGQETWDRQTEQGISAMSPGPRPMSHVIRAPLVPVTAAFLLGTMCAPTLGWQVSWLAGVALGFGVVALRVRSRRVGLAALLGLWAVLGMGRAAVWARHPENRLADWLPEEPAFVRLHGVVLDDPVQLFEPDDPAPQAAVVRLLHIEEDGGWRPIAGRVRARFHAPQRPLAYGDELLLEGEWSRVPPPANPGQYNWAAALARQRIHGLLTVRPFHGAAILRRDAGSPWLAAVLRLRARWERLIRGHFSAGDAVHPTSLRTASRAESRDAGLLLSLLLGQRVALDERLKRAFVETGTVHLLVISGFNVGLIAAIMELLLRLLGLPWRWRLAVSAAALGGYCVLTGLQPPVARATLMAWIVLGAYALDRAVSWPNALAAAALAIVWINPTQLLDAGFQLSFGAVASLLAFTSRWHACLEPRLAWLRPAWIRRYLAMSLASTAAVWAGLAPVLAWYFHLVSPVSMLANLLIAPLMSLLVVLGTVLLMAGTVFEPVVGWGGGILRLLLHATVWCVNGCHALPGGYWFVGHPSAAWLIGYYALVAVSLMRRRIGLPAGRLLLCWALALVVWGGRAAIIRWQESRWLQVDVLDVGHGDSLVVRTPAGRVLVVDAGSRDAGRFRVIPFLRHEGITSLDALLLTHTDDDHIGGAVPLLETLRIERLLTNGVRGDTMSARRVRALAAAGRIPHVTVAAGTQVAAGPDLRIDVLHPPPGLVPEVPPVSNDNSVVVKLTMGAVNILLTGDIEEAGLPWLLRQAKALPSSVLKVPHHGSRLGEAGERLFRAVHPSTAASRPTLCSTQS